MIQLLHDDVHKGQKSRLVVGVCFSHIWQWVIATRIRDYETCSITKQGFKYIKHVVYFPIIWGGYPFEHCNIVVQFNQLDTTK